MKKSLLFTAMVTLLLSCGANADAINKAIPAPEVDTSAAEAKGPQVAVLAGGCFWGLQGMFEHVQGVTRVVAGYSGGDKATAHYEMVGTESTGHAESVQITFDPKQISYGQLLRLFFSVAHDPTEVNRQGPDVGTQYRSAIFYTTPAQQKIVDAYIAQLSAAKVFRDPIVTEVKPLRAFYEAEAYHQNYYNLHPSQPYIVINDKPKVEALRAHFADLWQ